MPERPSVSGLLRTLRARVRRNLMAQEAVDVALVVAAGALLLAAWNATMPLSMGISAVWLVPLTIAVLARAAVRLRDPWPLWRAARRADRVEALHDELTSAHWFERHPEDGEWVDAHLDRARGTAAELDPRQVVPSERPRRLAAVAGCALGALAFAWLPVPRVFEPVVDRLGEIAAELTAPEDELIAALQDPSLEDPEDADPFGDDDRLELPEDGQEQEGEPGALEQQEPEGDEGEAPENAEEQMTEAEEGDEGQQDGEPQEMQVDNPEDLPESEGEQEPDPNQSQQEGQGESTEESGESMPAGEEVFLQDGGEEIEQMELGEEEIGHATREGGEEQQLELGELETLEVQLMREILETEPPPNDPEEPEEEEKEERVTEAEESRLEFRQVQRPDEGALQEILQSESVPWEYRQLVLAYFRALREKDNQPDEEGSRP